MSETGRIIGIQHRIKFSAEGEARPTKMSILANGKTKTYELADETAELDWVKGEFPVKYREKTEEDNLALFKEHHKKNGKVPSEFDGLKAGDTVVMVLGGSGDYFAYALSRQAETVGAQILRIPPFNLKQFRGEDKEDDSSALIKLYQQSPFDFQEVTRRDRENIALRGFFYRFEDSMKARIACEQRLRQQVIGEAFCQPDGLFPEGSIEKAFEAMKANDKIFQGLEAEEKKRERAMEKHLETMEIYVHMRAHVKGVGPRIASRILVAIGDINRFADSTRTDGGITRGSAKLTSYFGLDPRNGKFRRRRKGELASWSNDGRQAMFLLTDQFNRRPDTTWGQVLKKYVSDFHQRHPEVICKTCLDKTGKQVKWDDCKAKGHKRAYNPGHILTMAKWRTANKFLEWLWSSWTKLEKQQQIKKDKAA